MTSHRQASVSFSIVMLLAAAFFGLGIALVSIGASALRLAPAVATDCGCSPVVAATAQPHPGAWTMLAIGSLLLIAPVLRFVIVAVRTRRFIQSLPMVKLSPRMVRMVQKLNVTQPVIATDQEIDVAACLGLLTPRLLVSRPAISRLTDEELQAVLEHERYHALHRDTLRFALADAYLFLLRPFPYVGRIAVQFKTYVELAADEFAIQSSGTSDGLGGALLKFIRPSHASLAGFGGTTEQRIDQLLGRNPETKGLAMMMTAVVVTIGLALLGVSATAGAASAPIKKEITVQGLCRAQIHRCAVPPRASVNAQTGIQLISTK